MLAAHLLTRRAISEVRTLLACLRSWFFTSLLLYFFTSLLELWYFAGTKADTTLKTLEKLQGIAEKGCCLQAVRLVRTWRLVLHCCKSTCALRGGVDARGMRVE